VWAGRVGNACISPALLLSGACPGSLQKEQGRSMSGGVCVVLLCTGQWGVGKSVW